MKSRLVIAGLLIIAAVMLTSLSSVMATIQSPPLTVSQHDYVWTVDLLHPIDSGYSGKDVSKVIVQYYNMIQNPDPNGPPMIPDYHDLSYCKISIADSQIKIWIDTTAGFPEHAENSYVTVTFTDGVVQTFSGPGWAPWNVH